MLKFVKILCNVLLMDGLFNNAVISNNLTVSGNIECDSINVQNGVLTNISSINGISNQNLQTLDTNTSISFQLNNLNTNLTSYIDTKIDQLLYNSDLSLNSIVELSNAIGNDAQYAQNIATSLADKISKTSNNQTISANNLNFSGTNTLINDLYVNDTIMILDNSNNSVINLNQKLNTIDNNIANVISSNNEKNNQQDLSLNNLVLKDSQIDASLNDIIDDINLLTDRVDLSLNSLINKDTQIDASLNAIITKNNQQDTSLNNLINKDIQIDASLNSIITKNNQQDTSLNNIRSNFRDEVLNASSDKFGFYTADNTQLLCYDKPTNTLQIGGNLININDVTDSIGFNGQIVTNNNVIINSRNVITELDNIINKNDQQDTSLNNLYSTFIPKSNTTNFGIYDGGVPICIYNGNTSKTELFLNALSLDHINSRIDMNNNTYVNANLDVSGNTYINQKLTVKGNMDIENDINFKILSSNAGANNKGIKWESIDGGGSDNTGVISYMGNNEVTTLELYANNDHFSPDINLKDHIYLNAGYTRVKNYLLVNRLDVGDINIVNEINILKQQVILNRRNGVKASGFFNAGQPNPISTISAQNYVDGFIQDAEGFILRIKDSVIDEHLQGVVLAFANTTALSCTGAYLSPAATQFMTPGNFHGVKVRVYYAFTIHQLPSTVFTIPFYWALI